MTEQMKAATIRGLYGALWTAGSIFFVTLQMAGGDRSARLEDAAAQHGMELKYSQNQNGPEQATLVQNAIDSQVDGIAVTLANVDAVVPVTQKAVAAGIPVVAFNQGYDEFTEAGALMEVEALRRSLAWARRQ